MELARIRTMWLTKLKELEILINNNVLVFDTNKLLAMESEISALKRYLTPLDEELNRTDYLGTYSSFIGSPLQQGKFQFDLWDGTHADNYDWEVLRGEIKTHGVRNSLLVAPMPTASTSQILGNNECIEPFTSNIYLRRTLAGEFIVVNKYLMKDMLDLGLWNEDIKNDIIKHNGSIQHIQEIPEEIREIYKTVWEIGNKSLIDMAATRGKYICQSQSLNLFMDKPNFQKLSSMHFYAWRKGLKTGIYYLRTKPVAQAQQFTIEPEKRGGVGNSDKTTSNKDKPLILACSRDNPDCEACGS
jgi:ribonucleoside-diphosphate reductase alpha chain